MDGLDTPQRPVFYHHCLHVAGDDRLRSTSAMCGKEGIFAIRTTRGDRLFIGLLGSAYIHLFFIGMTDLPIWYLRDFHCLAYFRSALGLTTKEQNYEANACCKEMDPLGLMISMLLAPAAFADQYSDAAKKWVSGEFTPSTLSQEEQLKEMAWFTEAAKPFRGMEIKVVSETITTHEYESKVLAKAFEEITGIKLTHDLIQEGDVVEKLQTEMQSNRSIYDAYINDSDLIGTHFRYGKAYPISDYIESEGKDVTLPTLDLDDFIGISFTTGPDGKIYQLPDQQFANLYWFRADWFARDDLKKQFRDIYGYELGVPVNWSAYEDIAEFFSVHVKEIDGQRVYGHMDYGKKDPSLGWRFTDAWFSMAGAGDKGIPNGIPVDEWGIRVDGCSPVGSSVARGGATNGPAAVYATTKYVDWLREYAPPEAQGMTFSEAALCRRKALSPSKSSGTPRLPLT